RNPERFQRTWCPLVQHPPCGIVDAKITRAQNDLAARLVRSPFVPASEVWALAGEDNVWDRLFVDPDDLSLFIIKRNVAVRVYLLQRLRRRLDDPMVLVLFPLEYRILERLLEDVLHADVVRPDLADV